MNLESALIFLGLLLIVVVVDSFVVHSDRRAAARKQAYWARQLEIERALRVSILGVVDELEKKVPPELLTPMEEEAIRFIQDVLGGEILIDHVEHDDD